MPMCIRLREGKGGWLVPSCNITRVGTKGEEEKENNKQIKQQGETKRQMQFIKAKMMICMKCNMEA